jgi:N-formylglutamate amidohydrolase
MALGYYDPQLHRGITRYAREAGWVLLLDWHGAAQHDRRLNWFDWLQRELTNMTRKSI